MVKNVFTWLMSTAFSYVDFRMCKKSLRYILAVTRAKLSPIDSLSVDVAVK